MTITFSPPNSPKTRLSLAQDHPEQVIDPSKCPYYKSGVPGETPTLAQAVDYCSHSGFRVQSTKQSHVLGKEALKWELTIHFGGLELLKWKAVPPRAASSALPLSFAWGNRGLNKFGDMKLDSMTNRDS